MLFFLIYSYNILDNNKRSYRSISNANDTVNRKFWPKLWLRDNQKSQGTVRRFD